MNRHYWTWPIALYIFLGGLGGGMVFLTMLFDLLLGVGSVLVLGLVVGLVALVIGTLLLIFELGQPQIFYRAFVTKTSIIKWGAVLLSIALIAGVLWFLSMTPWPEPGHSMLGIWGWLSIFPWYHNLLFMRAMEIICGAAGLGVMVYTGVLFSSMKSRPFWNTPLLPVLFTTSALSTGCAALCLCAGDMWTYIATFPEAVISANVPAEALMFFPPAEIVAALQEYAVHMFHIIDIVLVFVELLIIFLYLLLMIGAGNETANRVAKRWIMGKETFKVVSWRVAFWGGMIFLGLVVPQALYLLGMGAEGGIIVTLSSYLAPILILCSGCLLRFLIVFSDDRRALPGEKDYYDRLPDGDEQFIKQDWANISWS